MNKTILENTMHTYFLNEIADFQRLHDRKPSWFDPTESKNRTLDRCFGVQEFAQMLGLDFSTINREYTEFKEAIEKIGVDK